MHRIVRPVLAFAILVVVACQSQSESASLDTENQKASYGIGLQMGAQLQPAESRIDMDAFLAGLRDGMAGEEPTIPQAEI